MPSATARRIADGMLSDRSLGRVLGSAIGVAPDDFRSIAERRGLLPVAGWEDPQNRCLATAARPASCSGQSMPRSARTTLAGIVRPSGVVVLRERTSSTLQGWGPARGQSVGRVNRTAL